MKFIMKITDLKGIKRFDDVNFLARSHEQVEQEVEKWIEKEYVDSIEMTTKGIVDIHIFQNILKINIDVEESQDAYEMLKKLVLNKFKENGAIV